jgi:hypothetical protein
MPIRAESMGLVGMSIPGIPGILVESALVGAGCIFIPLISM